MSAQNSITVSQSIHTTPAEALRGFTHPTLLRDWLSDAASTSPHVGGHLFLRWHNGRTVTGAYQQIDPQEVRFTWSDSQVPVPTIIRVTCKPEGGSTLLTVEQSGELGAEDAAKLERTWHDALENLASVIETGVDLRFARRPRLGIAMDEFTPEKAQRLGVPVSQGVLIAGTAPGSGAEAAGILKDDVLVSMNGVPLADYNSFPSALEGLKAGDSPTVAYYRGPQRFEVPLRLGKFPIPEFPASGRELAAKVRELDAEVSRAMRELLAGLSEEQASRRPASEEWSAKEMVGHFILTERDFQGWAADMLNDIPVEDSLLFRPNVTIRIDALIDRLRTLPALLDELALAKEETAALLEKLPESFTLNRKHLYRRLAQWEIEYVPAHYQDEHLEQFKTIIQAATG